MIETIVLGIALFCVPSVAITIFGDYIINNVL